MLFHGAGSMTTRQEVAFFDEFEKEHGDYDVLGNLAYHRLLDIFAQLTQPAATWKVLDCGCGSGAFTRRLSSRFGFNVTGIDISPSLIQRAAKQSDKEKYLVGSIIDTGLPTNLFDCLVYSGVLHHINDVADRRRTLQEGLRILRPGGCIFAYDPSWHSPSMRLYRDPSSPLYSSKGKTENEVLFKRDEIKNEIESAGFNAVKICGIGGITYRYIESRLARALLPLYNLYEILLRYSPLEDQWGTFLISFGKKQGVAV